jgi:hypothetical protein
MRLKTKVIVNPESNKGRTRKRWGEIRDGLRSFIRARPSRKARSSSSASAATAR